LTVTHKDDKVVRVASPPTETGAPFPVLLNTAHRTYTAAIAAALERAGFGDMPLAGYRVTVLLARQASGVQELAARLAVSKQATSRLVDVLVRRGYCDRGADEHDRRRLTLVLTERGELAAREIRRVIGRLDHDLARRVAPGDIAGARVTLSAVIAIGREAGR